MSQIQAKRTSGFVRTLKKFFVSGFLIVTFGAYALHEQTVSPNTEVAAVVRSQPIAAAQQPFVAPQATATLPALAAAQPTATPTATAGQLVLVPTATATEQTPPTATEQTPPTATTEPSPTPTAAIAGMYKDGTYTGPETNAVYGWVQVEAVVQNGKVTDVEFLEYPQDRRTSVRINSRAVPELQSEAIQAQSANVDIISGATLTSRAFIQSLQAALDAAKA